MFFTVIVINEVIGKLYISKSFLIHVLCFNMNSNGYAYHTLEGLISKQAVKQSSLIVSKYSDRSWVCATLFESKKTTSCDILLCVKETMASEKEGNEEEEW